MGAFKPIGFFSPDIRIGEVLSASSTNLFKAKGKTIDQVSKRKPCALSQNQETGEFLLEMQGGDFINFYILRRAA